MSAFKDFFVPTAVLTGICIVVSAALSATYAVTNPVIEANKRAAAELALKEVLPQADGFTSAEGELPDGISMLEFSSNDVGAVAQVSSPGYGGPVVMMVGVAADGTITGVKVLESTETQGLGSRVTDLAYTSQFKGKQNIEEVESVSGATVTSKAVKNGISIAKSAIMAGRE